MNFKIYHLITYDLFLKKFAQSGKIKWIILIISCGQYLLLSICRYFSEEKLYFYRNHYLQVWNIFNFLSPNI